MPTEKKKKRLTPAQAKINIENYCAYQERSHRQVRNKLFTYGLYSSEVESIISDLISSGFLNEERFAKAYAGGKFRMKSWGRAKIEYQLKGIDKKTKLHKTKTKNVLRTEWVKGIENNLKMWLKELEIGRAHV